ncbi:hypothetical protein [Robertmurraya sp. Marseille-Q9965]
MEIYIVLTDTGTVFTRFIKLFTKKPLNHASLSFTKELDSTFSFGRKRPNNPFVGGFVKEDMAGRLFKYADCAIYKCSVSKLQYEHMREFVRQIEHNQYCYKYNFIGLFGVLFNKSIDVENAFFCSQFVSTVLNSGAIQINSKPSSLVRPSDFMESKNLQLIYEGKLSEFLEQQGETTNRRYPIGMEDFICIPS